MSAPVQTQPVALAEIRLKGIAVSPGIVRGRVSVVQGGALKSPARRKIPTEAIDDEIARFHAAIETTHGEIQSLHEQMSEEIGTEAAIFEVHLLMVSDQMVLDEVDRRIRETKICAEATYYQVVRGYIESLEKLNDTYFRDRSSDMYDISRRVVRHLVGDAFPGKSAVIASEHIVIANDLTPSDTAGMDRSKVLGFATESGSSTSHTAILARALGIPAVVGLPGIRDSIGSGEDIILDGYTGQLILCPTAETAAEYDALKIEKDALTKSLVSLRETPCRTRDGKDIVLSANIGFTEDLPLIESSGAEGVGLYRTEFLFLNRTDLPSEDQQTAVYTQAAKAAGPQGVLFRTFDLGGDKLFGGSVGTVATEPNPFLGWRGIRVSLSEEEIFKTQIRAILRASVHGRVGLMYPMISGVREVHRANSIVADCMKELVDEKIEFRADISIGVMIEVPSAAFTADLIAPHVDFFSVGTNDLIQYTMAVDRLNERVADLYEPTHPAIVRLLKHIISAAKANKIWAGVCGEMAGDVLYLPLLVGLGIDELSVGAASLPRVKYAVQQLVTSECADLVAFVESEPDPAKIAATLREMGEKLYPELLY